MDRGADSSWDFSRMASRLVFSSVFCLLLASISVFGQELKAEEIGNNAESLVSSLDVAILVGVLGMLAFLACWRSWYVGVLGMLADLVCWGTSYVGVLGILV